MNSVIQFICIWSLGLAVIPAALGLLFRLKAKWLAIIFITLSLASSFFRVLSDSPTVYLSQLDFWFESGRCFYKGMIGSAIAGLWIFALLAFHSSVPSRAWRLLFSLGCALAAAILMAFRCESSSIAHIIVSHWAPGVLAAIGFWLILEGFSKSKGYAARALN